MCYLWSISNRPLSILFYLIFLLFNDLVHHAAWFPNDSFIYQLLHFNKAQCIPNSALWHQAARFLPPPQKKNQAFYGSPLSPCMQDVHSDDCSGSSFSRMCPECRVVYRTEFHFMNHVCRKVNNHVYTSTFTCKIVIAHSLSRFLFVCFFLS